jgi:lipopolysaccharide/colanic/teichoic acid biosynthesis glycosyltransferase
MYNFCNILSGRMSRVDPCLELPELVEKYQAWQRACFAIPQRLKGGWQIYVRSNRSMCLQTEQALYTVRNYPFWLDIQILIQTFRIVLRGKATY